ncbi:oncostatin-M-specific receptor subunit beta-like [Dendropsophus ebraccatus]|uniref:oncostatin-M-specific receptor subunit beta-like n=1 Tax=Dendropsophus ebraccatus TaxID=150705 RepID=UPI00383192A2
MDHCVGWHGVLVILFSAGLWHCQEAEVSFPPIDLEIHNDSVNQRLVVKWDISKNVDESDMDVIFHIQVARSERLNIIADEYFQPDLSRSRVNFIWTWDSQLPLECDSHSVRIQSKVIGKVSTNWSQWSPWKTHAGENTYRAGTVIFPHERVVPVGSNVTFCCLPGRGQTVEEMLYGRNKMERDPGLGTDSFVISLQNVTATKSDGSNVICVIDGNTAAGTVLIVSSLPDEPKNFSCVSQDLKTLRCRWSPGAVLRGKVKANYVLHEWLSMKSHTCPRDHCDWPIQMNQQMYNFTMTTTNPLGERRINSIVYLQQRVLLQAPSSLMADQVGASFITLSWSLKVDYSSLQIHCQVDLHKNLVNMTSRGKRPAEIYRVSLSGLQPYTLYNLRVRCMAESSVAGWSNWSNIVVRTQEDAPTGALDVWRRIKDDGNGGRTVTLYWRPSPLFRANGNISHYNITFWPLDGTPVTREISVSGLNSSQITIGGQVYSISVTAHNKAGRSPPAQLWIPARAKSDIEQMTAERTYSKDGGITLTWHHIPNVHGYVVEWCPAPITPHCDLQWKKYNSTIQSDVIKSQTFRPGVRYEFRIYGTMKDGDRLLKKMTGYMAEMVSSVKPKLKISHIESRSILLDWSPYPTDESQEGFITGYNIYMKDTESDCNLDKADEYIQQGNFHFCRFYIGDPNKMQIPINNLKPNGKYKVAVVAITSAGETPAEFTQAHTPADTRAALHSIIVPIIAVSMLALVLIFIGCWKREWLKRIFFPDIPDPNKSKIFSLNGPKGTLNGNIVPISILEAQMVDVISIQEKRQQYENVYSEHQLHEMYTETQTKEGCRCVEDFNENYVPYDEKSLYPPINDPSIDSQPFLYLDFINQSYTGVLDDVHHATQGYRPQTNIAEAHPPYVMQSAMLQPRPDDNPVIHFNGPDYGSEPMSPTSVASTTFILVD